MGSMFDVAFRKFADAFEQRADKVYGLGAAGKVPITPRAADAGASPVPAAETPGHASSAAQPPSEGASQK